MYIPGEALDLDNVVELSDINRDGSAIYTLPHAPGLLARNPVRANNLASEMLPIDVDLAEALFRLADYGIEFPGIGNLAIKLPEHMEAGAGYIYTTAHFVEGFNMRHEMAEVPFDVTMGTFNEMIRYYEDMSNDYSGRLYLTDLSLRQCLYGRALDGSSIDDGASHVNFIDYDRLLNNLESGVLQPPTWPGFVGMMGLDNDLRSLIKNFPDRSFDEAASRLLAFARRLGVVYWVPTAYDYVECS